MKTIVQILSIARTEFRFGFRRSAPAVATAVVCLLVGAGTLVPLLAILPEWAANSILTPEKIERLASYGLSPQEWAFFLREYMGDMFVYSTMLAWLLILLALLFLPMATSAGIPADRKFGVSEVLAGYPISGSTYLAGKVLGMLGTVLLVAAITLGVFFSVTEITLFYNLHYGLSANASRFLIEIVLLDGLPILVCGTTVGVLVGVFFRTRRAAIFPGFLAGLASLVGWVVAFKAPARGSMLGVTDLAYYYALQNYHSTVQPVAARLGGQSFNLFLPSGAPGVGIGRLALMYLTMLATLAALAFLARLWLKWKENF